MSTFPALPDYRRCKDGEIQAAMNESDVWVVRAQEDGTTISPERVQYRTALRNLRDQAATSQDPLAIKLPAEPPYALVPVVQWNALTLGSGLANSPGFVPARYRLTATKAVLIEGVIDCTPGLTNAARGKVLATLPSSAAPSARLAFKCAGSGTNDPRVEIATTGAITFEGFWNGTATVAQMSLCGIIFSAVDPLPTPHGDESTPGEPMRVES